VPIESGTEDGWTHPAFDGVIADGRVYGRGTLDDKQGVISLLEAAGSLLAEDFKPRKTIVFAFGHDEEVSGTAGAAALAARMQELGLKFDWMVDEGGYVIADSPMVPGRPLAMINVAEKGYLTLTLTATGPGGHSSRPPEIGTIGRLSRALDKIERNPFPTRLVGPVRAMFEALAPYGGNIENMMFNNLWLTDGLLARRMAGDPTTNALVRTTTALTMFNAGFKENVIPQKAVAKVNFRLLPGDSPEAVMAEIEKIIDDPEIEISHDQWGRIPPVADHEAEGFKVIAEATRAVYPDIVVAPSLLMATTDTRHYIDLADNHYRFHGNMIGMDQSASVHGTNEYVGVESFEKMVEIAVGMLRLGAQ
jgi:carboxypeptidase PM20D1